MSDSLVEQTISSEDIASGRFIRIKKDIVLLPDGKQATREYVVHPGAVAILALDNNGKIVMERQYRHSVAQVMLEIPAGKLDPQELELDCAKRELFEETGYTSADWIYLGSCLPCIGYSTERIAYFVARNIKSGIGQLDDGEFLEVILMPLEDVFNMAYCGELPDSKTLSGLMLLHGYLQR